MGKFVENSLISGEKVEQNAVISWFSQVWYVVFAIIFAVPMFPISLILVAVAVINVISTELAITNKKVIGKSGFIRRTSIDLRLNKLESINIDQGIIGRIFDYGTVTVRGTGGNVVSIPYIAKPMEFRRVVMNVCENADNSNQVMPSNSVSSEM